MHKGLHHESQIAQVPVLVELALFGSRQAINRYANKSVTYLVVVRIRRVMNQSNRIENDCGGGTAVFGGVFRMGSLCLHDVKAVT